MKRPKFFYVVTMHDVQTWIDHFERGNRLEFIGTKDWPYTRAQARKRSEELGGLDIYQFGLPFNNFIKQVR